MEVKIRAAFIFRNTDPYFISTNTSLQEGGGILHLCPCCSIADYLLQTEKIENLSDIFNVMQHISVSENNPWIDYYVPEGYLQRHRTIWTGLYDLIDRTMIIHYGEDEYRFHYPEFKD